jgi:hypothetical protein
VVAAVQRARSPLRTDARWRRLRGSTETADETIMPNRNPGNAVQDARPSRAARSSLDPNSRRLILRNDRRLGSPATYGRDFDPPLTESEVADNRHSVPRCPGSHLSGKGRRRRVHSAPPLRISPMHCQTNTGGEKRRNRGLGRPRRSVPTVDRTGPTRREGCNTFLSIVRATARHHHGPIATAR